MESECDMPVHTYLQCVEMPTSLFRFKSLATKVSAGFGVAILVCNISWEWCPVIYLQLAPHLPLSEEKQLGILVAVGVSWRSSLFLLFYGVLLPDLEVIHNKTADLLLQALQVG